MFELSAGDLDVRLAPETGGAIAAFTWRGIDVLRRVADKRLAAQHGRRVAAYPLIPFANRMADGRFSFGGQTFKLARNFGNDPNTIHGNAWMHPWQVRQASGTAARITLDFTPDGSHAAQWPFAYAAEQHYELADDRLRVTISLRNTDTRAFPAGIGLHPYVARTSQTSLRFAADAVWMNGPDELPQTQAAITGSLQFADGRLLGPAEIDTCYTGWAGQAVVSHQDDTPLLTLSAGPLFGHLQLYTPQGTDFIGLEPVSNMPDAFDHVSNASDSGLVVLQPGDAVSGCVVFSLG